ncbi:hypothetical protein ACN47E_008720 [Coniothyrium glycines]
MTVIIFGARYATRTQRVLLILEILGIPYELKNIDMQKGEHCSPDFIASHHPFGKLPALEDGNVKLFESRAISRYLVSKYPGSLSLPTDSAALGLFEEAASVEYSYFEPAASKLGFEKIFKKMFTGQEADANVVQQLEIDLRKVLDYYETILADRKWLAGQEFSLIDVFNVPWFSFLVGRLGYENDITSRPHVKAWWEAASANPAWKKVSGA